ncbi:hypothetical protein TRVL_09220 [Trypanosoma vivax]|nr:hypothetical protein TRVL_09220 [Trypanosoma vivax]
MARTQSMNAPAVFSPSFLRRTALVTSMGVSSVDRAGLNPACCGCSLSSMQSLTRHATICSISLHSVLAGVTCRKDAMLFGSFFGFSSGTMMPCVHLAGTCPVRKLQLNSPSTDLFDTQSSCFSSSQWVSSSPGAVPEYSSRSATSSSAS